MRAHGQERYVVIGEGELSPEPEDAEDPASVEADAASATSSAGEPASLARRAEVPFRFTRLGPRGRPLSEQVHLKMAKAMIKGGGRPTSVPAGFTYLGQFIDHDLTFDRTEVTLGEAVSPADLLQARSPSLDLDSLYGAGPLDPESEKFYADERHLAMGRTNPVGPDPGKEGFDLPRGRGRSGRARQKAVIPDPRNDENLAVAQTHLAMIRFHNRVVDKLPASVGPAARFERARRQVTKHYQWMIRSDYLPRIVRKSVVDDVFTNGRQGLRGRRPGDRRTDDADRVLRRGLPPRPQHDPGDVLLEPSLLGPGRFARAAAHVLRHRGRPRGRRAAAEQLDLRLPPALPLLRHRPHRPRPPEGHANLAMRLDTRLVNPLRNLPPGSFGGPVVPFNDPRANLAFRNLVRGGMVRLASGQQMAEFLRARGVAVTTLTRAQILQGKDGATLEDLTSAEKDALAERTPLWFYVLREAEHNGGKLDGVGARIVAETFHRAMEGSRTSIVRQPDWRPSLGPDPETFRMVDLLLFAFEGKKALLNPLGG